uniref:TIL domain-containing protein n=1 Tax=Panagrolaimus sp. PS1159 TaxID=55785 RepID=A0AC35F5W0_9BILA
MKNFFFFVFIFALIVADLCHSWQKIECNEPNEHPGSKKLNRCEPSCNNPEPRLCYMIGGYMCDCNDGYLRSSNGTCVLPSEC